VRLNGELLKEGDGAAIEDVPQLELVGETRRGAAVRSRLRLRLQ